MRKKILLTRLVSGAVVVAVTAGSALLVNGVASAIPPAGTLGFNTITPAEGADNVPMSSRTSGPCPSQSEAADLNVVGPIGADPATATFPPNNPFPVTQIDSVQFSTTGPFVQQFRLLLRDAANQRGRTIQPGEYHLTTNCLDQFGFTSFGTFTAGLIFETPTHYTVISNATPTPVVTPTPTPVVTPTPTPVVTPTPTPMVTPTPKPVVTPTPTPRVTPTPSPTPRVTPTPTRTPTPTPQPTDTDLTVFPNPADKDFPVILIARVDPGNAAGAIQFKDGNRNIGAPVPVQQFAGHAFALRITFLERGQHTVTANFQPANPARFGPSSDSEAVRVRD